MRTGASKKILLQGCLLLLVKLIVLLLTFTILMPAISLAIPDLTVHKDRVGTAPLSADTVSPDESPEEYPYIFVHGFLGNGESDNPEDLLYWGGSEESNLLTHLREEGKTVYAPSVGTCSSAWDRACELYAQLTGTVVDYGAAHAEDCHHSRYGRDYTGRALMGESWDLTQKLNLVGHSFGGQTIRVFTSLLAYGADEEVAATGEDTSPLFEGGHDNAVHAVITLSSPHNGTILSNFGNDLFWPVYAMGLGMNIAAKDSGSADYTGTDYGLDQWGLTAEPGSNEAVSIHLLKPWRIVFSKDNAGYDMGIDGARALNEKFPTVPTVYYLSYTADASDLDNAGGFQMTSNILQHSKGLIFDGVRIKEGWLANDGLVPTKSALYPLTDEENHADYQKGQDLKPGVWYTMPVLTGTHLYYCSPQDGDTAAYFAFYDNLTTVVDSMV